MTVVYEAAYGGWLALITALNHVTTEVSVEYYYLSGVRYPFILSLPPFLSLLPSLPPSLSLLPSLPPSLSLSVCRL